MYNIFHLVQRVQINLFFKVKFVHNKIIKRKKMFISLNVHYILYIILFYFIL